MSSTAALGSEAALDQDAPPSNYIDDTWGWKFDAATWTADLESPSGDPATANGWMADLVADGLADFSQLARVHRARLLAEAPFDVVWSENETYPGFRERLLHTIRVHPDAVIQIELSVDLRVWVRTVDSPEQPVLTWIRYPKMSLVFGTDLDAPSAHIDFHLTNTLFCAFTYPDKLPNPLYPLNHPLLEAALLRLRARSRTDLEPVGGILGKRELGFSPDRGDY